jgi:hypothetical protein
MVEGRGREAWGWVVGGQRGLRSGGWGGRGAEQSARVRTGAGRRPLRVSGGRGAAGGGPAGAEAPPRLARLPRRPPSPPGSVTNRSTARTADGAAAHASSAARRSAARGRPAAGAQRARAMSGQPSVGAGERGGGGGGGEEGGGTGVCACWHCGCAALGCWRRRHRLPARHGASLKCSPEAAVTPPAPAAPPPRARVATRSTLDLFRTRRGRGSGKRRGDRHGPVCPPPAAARCGCAPVSGVLRTPKVPSRRPKSAGCARARPACDQRAAMGAGGRVGEAGLVAGGGERRGLATGRRPGGGGTRRARARSSRRADRERRRRGAPRRPARPAAPWRPKARRRAGGTPAAPAARAAARRRSRHESCAVTPAGLGAPRASAGGPLAQRAPSFAPGCPLQRCRLPCCCICWAWLRLEGRPPVPVPRPPPPRPSSRCRGRPVRRGRPRVGCGPAACTACRGPSVAAQQSRPSLLQASAAGGGVCRGRGGCRALGPRAASRPRVPAPAPRCWQPSPRVRRPAWQSAPPRGCAMRRRLPHHRTGGAAVRPAWRAP